MNKHESFYNINDGMASCLTKNSAVERMSIVNKAFFSPTRETILYQKSSNLQYNLLSVDSNVNTSMKIGFSKQH